MANDKNMGLLKSVELFGDTMGERFFSHGDNNSLLIIASDGNKSLQIVHGTDEDLLDAISTVLYMDPALCEVMYRALGLVLMANVNHTEINIDE